MDDGEEVQHIAYEPAAKDFHLRCPQQQGHRKVLIKGANKRAADSLSQETPAILNRPLNRLSNWVESDDAALNG